MYMYTVRMYEARLTLSVFYLCAFFVPSAACKVHGVLHVHVYSSAIPLALTSSTALE